MPTRRVPTGGLAALAVVLAALAVVVVAGARGPVFTVTRAPVYVGRLVVPPTPRVAGRTPTHLRRVGTATTGATSATSGPPHARARARLSQARRALPITTTSTPPATTSSTTSTTVPPTAADGSATSRSGAFEGATTSTTERLGPVRMVSVTVPAGVEVTLVVTCGLQSAHSTSTTSVSVRLAGGSATCVAQFSVPRTTAGPARWHLVAR